MEQQHESYPACPDETANFNEGRTRAASRKLPPLGALAVLVLICALGAGLAAAQSDNGASEFASDPHRSGMVDADALLANPINDRAEFRDLYELRSWLAAQGGAQEALLNIVDNFAERGAWYSAVEILWFAEKLTDNEDARSNHHKRMGELMEKNAKRDAAVEDARQMFAAGRRSEAIDSLRLMLQISPYSEKGHYELARMLLDRFEDDDLAAGEPIGLEARAGIFRTAFEHLNFAIAIDPFYYDAHYLLANLRSILHDDAEFLVRTQFLSDRALYFRNHVVGPLEAIEGGDLSPAPLAELAEAMESIGILDYAVFAYQTAMFRGSDDPAVLERLKHLVDTYFAASDVE